MEQSLNTKIFAIRKPHPNKKRLPAGNDLLSQGVAPQVPSALAGLTSGFGMGPGISPPLKSPEESHTLYD